MAIAVTEKFDMIRGLKNADMAKRSNSSVHNLKKAKNLLEKALRGPGAKDYFEIYRKWENLDRTVESYRNTVRMKDVTLRTSTDRVSED